MSTATVVPGNTVAIVKANLDQGLSLYRSQAQAIVVSDQQGYITACQLALDVRAYMKDVKAKLGPGIDSAKQHLQRLQNDMNAYLAPAKEIDDIVSRKAETWKRAEREAAQREADEINRKAVEAQERADAKARAEARNNHVRLPDPTPAPALVVVAPSVPKVAGIKARVNWRFRITDASKLPRAYLMVDEVKIGQFVRETKKAGGVIPGVEAYSEDGI
jgi:hypothetical protein